VTERCGTEDERVASQPVVPLLEPSSRSGHRLTHPPAAAVEAAVAFGGYLRAQLRVAAREGRD